MDSVRKKASEFSTYFTTFQLEWYIWESFLCLQGFFQKRTFIIVVLATWGLWKYKSELTKVLFSNSKIKQKKNKVTRWAEFYDLKCMKWPDPLPAKVFHLALCWLSFDWEKSFKQEPGAMHRESCNKLQWAHIKTANRIMSLEEEDSQQNQKEFRVECRRLKELMIVIFQNLNVVIKRTVIKQF